MIDCNQRAAPRVGPALTTSSTDKRRMHQVPPTLRLRRRHDHQKLLLSSEALVVISWRVGSLVSRPIIFLRAERPYERELGTLTTTTQGIRPSSLGVVDCVASSGVNIALLIASAAQPKPGIAGVSAREFNTPGGGIPSITRGRHTTASRDSMAGDHDRNGGVDDAHEC